EIASLAAGRAGKIWWSRLHDPSLGAHALLVRAALLGPAAVSADTVRFTSSTYGWPMAGPKAKATPDAFFPSGFLLPKVGDWVVVATSGSDWGCLVMSVR